MNVKRFVGKNAREAMAEGIQSTAMVPPTVQSIRPRGIFWLIRMFRAKKYPTAESEPAAAGLLTAQVPEK